MCGKFFYVTSETFISFLSKQRDLEQERWIYLQPIGSEFEEVTIVLPKKHVKSKIWVFIKKYEWEEEIYDEEEGLDYKGLRSFLIKHNIRKVEVAEIL